MGERSPMRPSRRTSPSGRFNRSFWRKAMRVLAPASSRRPALPNCAPAGAARQAALGLWADPYYSAQAADRPGDIAARRGQFTVVEGDVVSVRESRGTTYINFGRRWSESFAAVILKRNAGALLAAGINPKLLQGRRVEVRGFVELRGGPRMEIMRPEQLNVVR